MAKTFKALVVDKTEKGFVREIRELTREDLPPGELLIRVCYSSVNYKDGLAGQPNGRVVTAYPLVPGIDLAGEVAESADARFPAGTEVLVTGYGLGVSHSGGYAAYARVPADWAVRLPAGLTPREAMACGTAGFTAALSVARLEAAGLAPEHGPVLVTGATGGVGSFAVAMLAQLGYRVAAGTGKAVEHAFLRELGAAEVVPREELAPPEKPQPLGPQRWAAAVDPVGGPALARTLATVRYGGAVAVSGLAGGTELPATVLPFILRGVSLLGIDSVQCPMEQRQATWQRLAGDLKPRRLEAMIREIPLKEVPEAMDAILQGRMRGRLVVRL
ncbi:oxidoreductase [Paenibacillus sp. CC-CFT747]|nr:oxidoreductase [Paenibacillus sp. CC-CFT747]